MVQNAIMEGSLTSPNVCFEDFSPVLSRKGKNLYQFNIQLILRFHLLSNFLTIPARVPLWKTAW